MCEVGPDTAARAAGEKTQDTWTVEWFQEGLNSYGGYMSSGGWMCASFDTEDAARQKFQTVKSKEKQLIHERLERRILEQSEATNAC